MLIAVRRRLEQGEGELLKRLEAFEPVLRRLMLNAGAPVSVAFGQGFFNFRGLFGHHLLASNTR
jgi:hypothetical protein